MKKQIKILEISKFLILPYIQEEISQISETCLLLRILTVLVINWRAQFLKYVGSADTGF